MGALHEGHLSLVKAARAMCDEVVVSVFVNPTQFGPEEDFSTYPRDVAADRALLLKEGVDEIWFPTVEEIYPEGVENVVRIQPPHELTEVLCGRDRREHFSGVATVVKRLFEVVQPTDVYFGQKDFQQTRVMDWLIRTFFPVIQLHILPTVREEDGLAMSSRNRYLSKKERELALLLSQSLQLLNKLFEQGERRVSVLGNALVRPSLEDPGIELQYAEIRDALNLHPIDEVKGKAVAAIAVKIGKTRLIDNLLLDA